MPLPENTVLLFPPIAEAPAALASDAAKVVAPLSAKLAMQPPPLVVFEHCVLIVTMAVCVPLTVTIVEAAVAPVRVDV